MSVQFCFIVLVVCYLDPTSCQAQGGSTNHFQSHAQDGSTDHFQSHAKKSVVSSFAPSPQLNIPGSWKVSSYVPVRTFQRIPEIILIPASTVKIGQVASVVSGRRRARTNILPRNTPRQANVQQSPFRNQFRASSASSRRARKISNAFSSKFKYQNPEFYFPKNRLKRMNEKPTRVIPSTHKNHSQSSRTQVETFFKNFLAKSSKQNINSNLSKKPPKKRNNPPKPGLVQRAIQVHAFTKTNHNAIMNHLYELANRIPVQPNPKTTPQRRTSPKRKEIDLDQVKLKAKVEFCPKLFESAELTCSMSGYEDELPLTKISWVKKTYTPTGPQRTTLTLNDKSLLEGHRIKPVLHLGASKYNLKISPFNRADIGTYECHIFVGNQSKVAEVPLFVCL